MLNADDAIIRRARFDDYMDACRLNNAVDELHPRAAEG